MQKCPCLIKIHTCACLYDVTYCFVVPADSNIRELCSSSACCLSSKPVSGGLYPLFNPSLLLPTSSLTENNFAVKVEVLHIEIGRNPSVLRVFFMHRFKELPFWKALLCLLSHGWALGGRGGCKEASPYQCGVLERRLASMTIDLTQR